MDPSRLTKLPSSTTVKESIDADNSAMPAPEQKKIQTGIASVKDSFEQVKQANPLFTANPNTGEVSFGDGVSGKTPPIGGKIIAPSYNPSERLLQETKAEISSYLKGGNGTASPELTESFRSMKNYLTLAAQNEKIDNQMQEAKEKAKAAMDQATTGMVIGVVGGALSIVEAAAQLKGIASQAKSNLAQSNTPAQESRFQHFTSLLDDFEKVLDPGLTAPERQSDKVQKDISEMEQAADAGDKGDLDASTSKAHRDKIRDAIIDFMQKMRDMNPQI